VQRQEVHQPRRAGDRQGDLVGVQAVDLVEHGDDGEPRGAQAVRDEAVAASHRLGGVQHVEGGVAIGEALVDRRLHPRREPVGRPLEPRQVEQHRLPVVPVRHGGDAPAGRLGARRDRGHLPAGEGVRERRLPHVGSAGERHQP
jgi:hypothetical protein